MADLQQALVECVSAVPPFHTQCAEKNLSERSKDEKLLYTGLMSMLQGLQKYFFQNPRN